MNFKKSCILGLFLIISITNHFTVVLSRNNVFQTLASYFQESLSNLPTFVRTLGETLSAAIDETCQFKCPNGATPRHNPYYEPKGNGCGVPGLQIPKYIPTSQLEDCCTFHDICYGTCNSSKEKCDEKFKKCLYGICERYKKYINDDLMKGCKVVAKTLYTAVTAVGCKYYLDAQKEACICSNKYSNDL